ncbi:iron complex outermembrane recepter protein [Halpernia humi]|uniref:Iron complex outermembrane recepter protein n=1 Tax=Halpernia humi TaxID=493375 RepID=A0A1H5UH19_9FLAO|nr:TonB-dependent receptor plug domain-containing protein [Halpernia humi]SEF74312.1 iron complex outermembrane recepter protein [Halpernia humi]
MKGFFILGLCAGPIIFAQKKPQDSLNVKEIESVNFTRRLPVSKDIINVEKDLGDRNLGQDLPILLKNQTSVLSTSDAGNGVGYTGFRIRGVGGSSINVMLNGVPYNDSESQGTYFVDVPDLASSASNIIIQRGVGTSSNGVSAFGASVNVLTKDPSEKFYLKSDASFGSFNTQKYAAEIGSGKFLNNKLSLFARYSKIHSDGYVDRAFSDLDSYQFTALYEAKKTKLRFLTFGGKEKTYQAWNGIDRETWLTNPKFNISGAIYDPTFSKIIGFYNNETDNYKQNHYQLLWEQILNKNWNLETTFHYTKGQGYYDNYKQDAKFSTYNLPNIFVNNTEVANTDFTRKKWLNNDFYGAVSTLYGKFNNLDVNFGVVANQYFGRHFGNVSGVQFPEINAFEYYRNTSLKNEISGFAKALVKVNNFEFFGDLQVRNIGYSTKIIQQGDDEGVNLDKNWLFFNPKFGINYKIIGGKLFFSYAHAHREPNRDDLFSNPETQAEKLHDFEAGLEKKLGNASLTANVYFMNYENQLVYNGQINNVGEFIRVNSGKSYRAGIEIATIIPLSRKFLLAGNATFSQNKNKNFISENNLQNLGTTSISLSPDIISNLSLQYSPIQNFNLKIQSQYVGKQYLDNTENKLYQLKDYVVADFLANYQLKINRNDFTFKLLVNNLFNKKYVNNGFVYDGPYYFSQSGTIVSIGVSWKFFK